MHKEIFRAGDLLIINFSKFGPIERFINVFQEMIQKGQILYYLTTDLT